MTENDYIAEYIKEKYPQLLGVDFGLWKFGRQISNAARTLGEVFSKIDYNVLREEMEKSESDLDDTQTDIRGN
jgi:hypothetical protein